jgi:hypothetical protein
VAVNGDSAVLTDAGGRPCVTQPTDAEEVEADDAEGEWVLEFEVVDDEEQDGG